MSDEFRAASGGIAVTSRELGARIRSLRRFTGFTTRQLADAIGVTPGAIVQIEHGAMRPSVNRLIEIVSVLDVPLAAVFDEHPAYTARTISRDPALEQDALTVSRAVDAPPLGLGNRVQYRRLTPSAVAGFEMFETTYPPRAASGGPGRFLVHRGREIGSVISGILTIEFADSEVALGARDSITFSADRPHRVRNDGREPAIALWVTFHDSA